MQMNKANSQTPPPQPGAQPEPPKRPPTIKAESLIAAGGTATGSLLIWVVSQIVAMESIVNKLAATQNQLLDDSGLIRPSTVAIKAEIQILEMYARLDRLEKALVVRDN